MVTTFAMWGLVNAMDVAISVLGVKYGAGEVGFLAGVPGSWTGLAITKMVLAAIIGAVLLRKKREDLLALLGVGMGAVCAFNSSTLIRLLGV